MFNKAGHRIDSQPMHPDTETQDSSRTCKGPGDEACEENEELPRARSDIKNQPLSEELPLRNQVDAVSPRTRAVACPGTLPTWLKASRQTLEFVKVASPLAGRNICAEVALR
ncbi:hypothetical protein DL765_001496 [Monosporascus sp. GIB2]|nr:hypothetical protein DL765_001496 [Monosporascus sp. GIB2]